MAHICTLVLSDELKEEELLVMPRTTDRTDEIVSLQQELQRIRQQSLAASRNGDFRTVGRLTAEAARLNSAILQAEGLRMATLDNAQDRFFTSDAPAGKTDALVHLS
jgi:hypothetical protein